ncbi:MAG: GNAT family N-acetyltransferase [Acidobacteriota bacterium]
MTPGISLEILDLRHFSAPLLRPLLEAEGGVWRERLHWDYHNSARLLMQYLDSHMLPGYAAVDAGRVIGYAFCVYEDTKAVVGDVFAHPGEAGGSPRDPDRPSATELENTLLRHLFETLQNSPHVDRIESQLLVHSSGEHASVFREAQFTLHPRLFMIQALHAGQQFRPALPPALELRTWRDDDLNAAARLISLAYSGHPDSVINDQYRTASGSLRFLHNIVRYAGCGAFVPQVSSVVIERGSRDLVGLILGSRVSAQSGHITQICVRPDYRRRGLARVLLNSAATEFWRQGMTEVSLTVTQANAGAINLYREEAYECRHTFDAAVWER